MSREPYDESRRGRGQPPTDAALILDRGGDLFFPGRLPNVKGRLNSAKGYLRKRGKHVESLEITRNDVAGVVVYAVPDDAPRDGTWGLAHPRLTGGSDD